MTEITQNARPKFETSTLEVFTDELFRIHNLPQVQEDLDKVHKLVMLTDDEHFPLIDKQSWWETYKRLKITTTCFQTSEHPEAVFEVIIQL